MKTVNQQAAQGDVLFIRVDHLPKGTVVVEPKNGVHVVAHSETGHHHTVDASKGAFFSDPQDPFTCYLQLASDAAVTHHRPFDTHAAFGLTGGLWMVRRQREYVPAGQRMVVD